VVCNRVSKVNLSFLLPLFVPGYSVTVCGLVYGEWLVCV
jgi:hypothetical protein